MDNEIKENLIILLKIFKDKPQYLIKFLLENNAFTEDFLTNIFNSEELNRLKNLEIEECNEDLILELPHFKKISDMNSYLKKIVNNTELSSKQENIYDRITKELKTKLVQNLKEAVEKEDYEEAAKLRDRMKELNIDFKNI